MRNEAIKRNKILVLGDFEELMCLYQQLWKSAISRSLWTLVAFSLLPILPRKKCSNWIYFWKVTETQINFKGISWFMTWKSKLCSARTCVFFSISLCCCPTWPSSAQSSFQLPCIYPMAAPDSEILPAWMLYMPTEILFLFKFMLALLSWVMCSWKKWTYQV